MIYYAVIDTNVLVSALYSKRNDVATVQVLTYMFEGTIIPLYDKRIITEYEDVLHRSKFKFDRIVIHDLIDYIVEKGMKIDAKETKEFFADEDDKIFYEVVMSTDNKNKYLVTGNKKHYPVNKIIITPREMINIIERNKRY